MPHDQISFWNATSLACLDNSEEDSSAGHRKQVTETDLCIRIALLL